MSDDELLEAWIMSPTDATFEEWNERRVSVDSAAAANFGRQLQLAAAMQNSAPNYAALQAAAMQNTHALGTFSGTLGGLFPNRLF